MNLSGILYILVLVSEGVLVSTSLEQNRCEQKAPQNAQQQQDGGSH